LAKSSFFKKWEGIINGKEYSHSRVYIISGDQFYALLTAQPHAFYNLYKILPIAVDDFLKTIDMSSTIQNNILAEISRGAKKSKRNLIDEITFENFYYYEGCKTLDD
jgi:hypothetical protein